MKLGTEKDTMDNYQFIIDILCNVKSAEKLKRLNLNNMTKKQLQKQIDELRNSLDIVYDVLYPGVFLGNGFRRYSPVNEINGLIKKQKALEQYLGIEYKVTESKREEGYVKKEVVVLGVDVGYTPKKK